MPDHKSWFMLAGATLAWLAVSVLMWHLRNGRTEYEDGYMGTKTLVPKVAHMTSSERNCDDLHGNAPDRSSIVLLLVDVINELHFPQKEELVRECANLAERIANLKHRCKRAGIPTIYINDNHGKWRSDFGEVLRYCLRPDAPGRAMVKRLSPEAEDYIVLKPKHSAFYATPLETLLEHIGMKTVIMAGITTNACVMITASDSAVSQKSQGSWAVRGLP